LPTRRSRYILACMSIRVLPPTNDWIFKLLFGDERNKSVLIDMLKSFVDLPDEEYELTFMDTHVKREFREDKLGILDVKVRTKTGKVINIEIQVEPQDYIAKRLSFYKSKMIVEQIGKKESYERIQRVICVCITSKPLFLGAREYLNRFRFCNLENGLCFDEIPEEIYTLELSKVPVADDGTDGWEWMRFLLARTKEEIEMLTTANPEIRKAADALYRLSEDPDVRAQYDMWEKAERDHISRIDAAERKVHREWQGVVAIRDAVIANKDTENERLRLENERLMAQIAGLQAKPGS